MEREMRLCVAARPVPLPFGTIEGIPVKIRPGDHLVLHQDVYQHGTSELVIRAFGITFLNEPAWAAVDGVEIAGDGREGMPRSIRVLSEALAEAKRLGDARYPK